MWQYFNVNCKFQCLVPSGYCPVYLFKPNIKMANRETVRVAGKGSIDFFIETLNISGIRPSR